LKRFSIDLKSYPANCKMSVLNLSLVSSITESGANSSSTSPFDVISQQTFQALHIS